MSNRLVEKMNALRSDNRSGVAPYVTAGDGGMETTLSVLHALDQAGASCIELGIPFSDPIADGPVLQAASERALASGASLNSALAMLSRFRTEGGQAPIAVMSYANPLVRNGLSETAQRVADSGGDALIVPDIPLEEGAMLEEACALCGLCPVFFAAPTSSDERIQEAGARTRGFLYVVGRVGVTGAGTTFGEETQSFLNRAQKLSQAPIAVGFGISSPESVRAAVQNADLAIVGTALVQRLHESNKPAIEADSFLRELLQGLN
ncbi:MAG: tryptophan synthase subunit alpha [Planctomycetota bacterium]|jgi:tryptophan synthase alpha chain|nr:tryptophan synthase subunit alpha [Planctomycetota bacterium]|tara:strand:- start:82 stop:873 length:792 start_codon:yes stop_codon:yes gene_type:complete